MKDVRSVPRVGVWSWSFVGFVAATVIVAIALGAVSEIVLPAVFAAVLAVVFKPLVGKLERRGLKPTLAAGVIVLGLAALMTVVAVGTVRGIVQPAFGARFDWADATTSGAQAKTTAATTCGSGDRGRGCWNISSRSVNGAPFGGKAMIASVRRALL